MDLFTFFYAIMIGAVQGVTEFLPVSSSAHLILVSWFVDGSTMPIGLNIALHLGTVFAVLAYFWKDWFKILSAVLPRCRGVKSFESDVLLPSLLVGSLPAGIIGVLWQDRIEEIFHNPAAVIGPLAIVGVLLWFVDRRQGESKSMTSLRIKDAFLIGIAQAFALIPGTSRSGATMLCGRMLNYTREDAAKYSFLLGTPAMLGAALLNSKEILTSLGQPEFYVGFTASAVVGCLSIAFLMGYVKRFGFRAFAIYRVLLAAVIAILLFLGQESAI